MFTVMLYFYAAFRSVATAILFIIFAMHQKNPSWTPDLGMTTITAQLWDHLTCLQLVLERCRTSSDFKNKPSLPELIASDSTKDIKPELLTCVAQAAPRLTGVGHGTMGLGNRRTMKLVCKVVESDTDPEPRPNKAMEMAARACGLFDPR